MSSLAYILSFIFRAHSSILGLSHFYFPHIAAYVILHDSTCFPYCSSPFRLNVSDFYLFLKFFFFSDFIAFNLFMVL